MHHAKKPLDLIFFPMIDCLTSDLSGVQASRTCPTVATTPAAVKAAFTKEGDLFKEKGVTFLDTFVNIGKPELFERQMWEQFGEVLGLSPEENKRAVEQGYKALDYFNNVMLRGAGSEVLEKLEREDRHRHCAAGPAVSQRSGRESRNSGRVPEAGLSRVLAGCAAD